MKSSDILFLKTPDDGRKRPKHVVILCFTKLTGYIDSLIL
jgi:hypothetical protein